MRAQYLWRNCFVKELNVAGPWQNLDGQIAQPTRQDLFWVATTKLEARDNILYKIKDNIHFSKISEMLNTSIVEELYFMITRNVSYIQYYPYMNINSKYSQWEKIPETVFNNLSQLSYICQSES